MNELKSPQHRQEGNAPNPYMYGGVSPPVASGPWYRAMAMPQQSCFRGNTGDEPLQEQCPWTRPFSAIGTVGTYVGLGAGLFKRRRASCHQHKPQYPPMAKRLSPGLTPTAPLTDPSSIACNNLKLSALG